MAPIARLLIAGGALLALAAPMVAQDADEEALPRGAVARFGSRRLYHDGGATAVAVSPDGARVASAGADGVLRLWRIPDGQPLARATLPAAPVRALAFAADGTLAVGHADGRVQLRDGASLDKRGAFSSGTALAELAWVPGTPLLAVAGPDGVAEWKIPDAQRLAPRQGAGRGAARSLAVSRDGAWIAWGGDDGRVHLEPRGGKGEARVLQGHASPVLGVAFAPDGKRLASGAADETVRVWNVPAGTVASVLKWPMNPVNRVAWTPDGEALISGGLACIRAWRGEKGRNFTTDEPDTGPILGLASGPGRLLASASADGLVRLWNVEQRARESLDLVRHRGPIRTVAFNADGSLAALGGADAGVSVWAVPDGVRMMKLQIPTTPRNRVNAVAFSPDGKVLAAGYENTDVVLWPLDPTVIAQHGGRREVRLFDEDVRVLAYQPDGQLVVGGCSGVLHVLDLAARVPPQADERFAPESGRLRAHVRHVAALCLSKDGTTAVTAARDGSIRTWNLAKRAALHELRAAGPEVHALAHDPAHHRVWAALEDGTVVALDDATGKLASTLTPGPTPQLAVAVSPDGTRVAAAGADATVRVFDAAKGTSLATLGGHAGPVDALAISPDGKYLLSGSADHTALLWTLPR